MGCLFAVQGRVGCFAYSFRVGGLGSERCESCGSRYCTLFVMTGCYLSVFPAVFARKTMPVTEFLDNYHQRSNLLLAPRPCNIQSRTPPTQSPNCTFRKRYNLFRSRTKRHLQSNDWTKAHFDSRCVPRCFEPGQRIF